MKSCCPHPLPENQLPTIFFRGLFFLMITTTITWWTFRIFFIFFWSGRGKGEFEAPGRAGGSVFIENARKGGGFARRGREGVCGELGNLFFGGGG